MSRMKILSYGPDLLSQLRLGGAHRPKTLFQLGLSGLLSVSAACTTAVPEIPPPRPIIIHSGARIRADHERMKEVNEWVTREDSNIELDPSFMVVSASTLDEVFPWEGLLIQ